MKKILVVILLTGLNADNFQKNRDACNDGNTVACFKVGLDYHTDKYGSDFEAVRLFKYTCDHGYAKGCSYLGLKYASGKGIRQDYVKAKKFYTIGCEGKDKTGCLNLATLYYAGNGVKKNDKTAKEYYGKACDLGSNDGCEKYTIMNREQ